MAEAVDETVTGDGAPKAGFPDSPKGGKGATPRTRGAIIALVIGVAAVAVAVAVGVVWMQQPSGPQQAFDRMTAASRAHDWAQVQRYIDFEAIADSAIAGATSLPTSDTGAAPSSSSMGGQPLDFDRKMKPAYIRQQKLAFETAVTSGSAAAAGGFVAMLAGKVIDAEASGQDATLTIEAPAPGGKANVVIRMRQDANGWRVVDLVDDGAPQPQEF